VTKDIPAGVTVLGAPAEPRAQAARTMVAVRKLPDLMRTVRGLGRTVNKLCEAAGIEKAPEDD
jgi:hypothetical protein